MRSRDITSCELFIKLALFMFTLCLAVAKQRISWTIRVTRARGVDRFIVIVTLDPLSSLDRWRLDLHMITTCFQIFNASAVLCLDLMFCLIVLFATCGDQMRRLWAQNKSSFLLKMVNQNAKHKFIRFWLYFDLQFPSLYYIKSKVFLLICYTRMFKTT